MLVFTACNFKQGDGVGLSRGVILKRRLEGVMVSQEKPVQRP